MFFLFFDLKRHFLQERYLILFTYVMKLVVFQFVDFVNGVTLCIEVKISIIIMIHFKVFMDLLKAFSYYRIDYSLALQFKLLRFVFVFLFWIFFVILFLELSEVKLHFRSVLLYLLGLGYVIRTVGFDKSKIDS